MWSIGLIEVSGRSTAAPFHPPSDTESGLKVLNFVDIDGRLAFHERVERNLKKLLLRQTFNRGFHSTLPPRPRGPRRESVRIRLFGHMGRMGAGCEIFHGLPALSLFPHSPPGLGFPPCPGQPSPHPTMPSHAPLTSPTATPALGHAMPALFPHHFHIPLPSPIPHTPVALALIPHPSSSSLWQTVPLFAKMDHSLGKLDNGPG